MVVTKKVVPDYTRADVEKEAKRILAEAIRYIDGDAVKPITNNCDALEMVADATGLK